MGGLSYWSIEKSGWGLGGFEGDWNQGSWKLLAKVKETNPSVSRVSRQTPPPPRRLTSNQLQYNKMTSP